MTGFANRDFLGKFVYLFQMPRYYEKQGKSLRGLSSNCKCFGVSRRPLDSRERKIIVSMKEDVALANRINIWRIGFTA